MIHKAVLGLTSLMVASTASAGGLAPVVVEDVPVVETKPASSISPLLILGLLILIGILVSRNNNDDGGSSPTGSVSAV